MRLAELFKRQGATAKVAVYETQAQRAFEGALKLGQNAGLSNRQMNRDLDGSLSPEPRKLFTDPDYFDQTASTCKAIGLM